MVFLSFFHSQVFFSFFIIHSKLTFVLCIILPLCLSTSFCLTLVLLSTLLYLFSISGFQFFCHSSSVKLFVSHIEKYNIYCLQILPYVFLSHSLSLLYQLCFIHFQFLGFNFLSIFLCKAFCLILREVIYFLSTSHVFLSQSPYINFFFPHFPFLGFSFLSIFLGKAFYLIPREVIYLLSTYFALCLSVSVLLSFFKQLNELSLLLCAFSVSGFVILSLQSPVCYTEKSNICFLQVFFLCLCLCLTLVP